MGKLVFFSAAQDLAADRFDDFYEWARPYGSAGVNHIHTDNFSSTLPYFDWSSQFFAHGDKSSRSWFLKLEFLREGRSVFTRARNGNAPVILNSNGLVEGKFLRFAKAYLNITAYYRNSRTPLKPLVQAFSFLEKSLRSLHQGDNDPGRLTAKVFEKAVILLADEGFTPGQQYDIANELEILAAMLQGGYHSKTLPFAGRGFQLLNRPFAFASPFQSRPRRRAIVFDSGEIDVKPKRMTVEDVSAVGLAYRKSISLYGPLNTGTFMAAIAGLALTTVSMRVSDLLTLQRDAIYTVDESAQKRIRIGRPKIALSQDLPISRKLGALAEELFACLLAYSAEANEAFRFYVNRYGEDFSSIDEVFVPHDVRHYFERPFLSVQEVYCALRLRPSDRGPALLPPRVGNLKQYYFIRRPWDIWTSAKYHFEDTKFIKIAEVELHCRAVGLESKFPVAIDRELYVSAATAAKFVAGARYKTKSRLLQPLFANGILATRFINTDELKRWLLNDFKLQTRYPHWPYTTKERSTRVDDALLVCQQVDFDSRSPTSEMTRAWWQPVPVAASSINRWISTDADGGPPLLFRQLNVTLMDQSYPSISLHDTRKFHQTQALLAGAHEVFIDELAGRRSGPQSDHYDLRSASEIILRSIETFDPDIDFVVAGPVADEASAIRLVDRATFLYENAAPKHITEIGGCATDWSLDPCKQYGDCMRCDQQLWRKGDVKRLPLIVEKRSYAIKMVAVAEERLVKYERPPRSLALQLQQFKDDVKRCDLILTAEEDAAIPLGAIVTFSAPEGTMTASELTARLAST